MVELVGIDAPENTGEGAAADRHVDREEIDLAVEVQMAVRILSNISVDDRIVVAVDPGGTPDDHVAVRADVEGARRIGVTVVESGHVEHGVVAAGDGDPDRTGIDQQTGEFDAAGRIRQDRGRIHDRSLRVNAECRTGIDQDRSAQSHGGVEGKRRPLRRFDGPAVLPDRVDAADGECLRGDRHGAEVDQLPRPGHVFPDVERAVGNVHVGREGRVDRVERAVGIDHIIGERNRIRAVGAFGDERAVVHQGTDHRHRSVDRGNGEPALILEEGAVEVCIRRGERAPGIIHYGSVEGDGTAGRSVGVERAAVVIRNGSAEGDGTARGGPGGEAAAVGDGAGQSDGESACGDGEFAAAGDGAAQSDVIRRGDRDAAGVVDGGVEDPGSELEPAARGFGVTGLGEYGEEIGSGIGIAGNSSESQCHALVDEDIRALQGSADLLVDQTVERHIDGNDFAAALDDEIRRAVSGEAEEGLTARAVVGVGDAVSIGDADRPVSRSGAVENEVARAFDAAEVVQTAGEGGPGGAAEGERASGVDRDGPGRSLDEAGGVDRDGVAGVTDGEIAAVDDETLEGEVLRQSRQTVRVIFSRGRSVADIDGDFVILRVGVERLNDVLGPRIRIVQRSGEALDGTGPRGGSLEVDVARVAAVVARGDRAVVLEVAELDGGGMGSREGFEVDGPGVDGGAEVGDAVDEDVVRRVGEEPRNGDRAVDLHDAGVGEAAAEGSVHAVVVDESAGVAEVAVVGHVIGGVGECPRIADGGERGPGRGSGHQHVSARDVPEFSGEGGDLAHGEFAGVGHHAAHGDAAVDDEISGIEDVAVEDDLTVTGGDVQRAALSDGDDILQSGAARLSGEGELAAGDLDRIGQSVSGGEDQFAVVGNGNRGGDVHTEFGLDGDVAAVNGKFIGEHESVGVTGDPHLAALVHQREDHSTGIGDLEVLIIGDGAETVGVVDVHEVVALHVAEGVSGTVHVEVGTVGEESGELVVAGVDGEDRPALAAGSGAPRAAAGGVGRAAPRLTLDLQTGVAVDGEIGVFGASRVLRLHRERGVGPVGGTAGETGGESHQVGEVIVFDLAAAPESGLALGVDRQIAADRDLSRILKQELGLAPDADVADVSGDSDLSISADDHMGRVERRIQVDIAAAVLPERPGVTERIGVVLGKIPDRDADPVVQTAGNGDAAAGDIEVSFGGRFHARTVNGAHVDVMGEGDRAAGDVETAAGDGELGVEENVAGADVERAAGDDELGERHLAGTGDGDRAGLCRSRRHIGAGGGVAVIVIIVVVTGVAEEVVVDPLVTGTRIGSGSDGADVVIENVVGEAHVAARDGQSAAVPYVDEALERDVVSGDLERRGGTGDEYVVGDGAGCGIAVRTEVEDGLARDLCRSAFELHVGGGKIQHSAHANASVDDRAVAEVDIGRSRDLQGGAFEGGVVSRGHIQCAAGGGDQSVDGEIASGCDIHGARGPRGKSDGAAACGIVLRGDGDIVTGCEVHRAVADVEQDRNDGIVADVKVDEIVGGSRADDVAGVRHIGGQQGVGSRAAESEVAGHAQKRIFAEYQLAHDFDGAAVGNGDLAVENKSVIGGDDIIAGLFAPCVERHDGGLAAVFDPGALTEIGVHPQLEVCSGVIAVLDREKSPQTDGVDVFVVARDGDARKQHVLGVGGAGRRALVVGIVDAAQTDGTGETAAEGIGRREERVGVPDVPVNGDRKIELAHGSVEDEIVVRSDIDDKFIGDGDVGGKFREKHVRAVAFDMEAEVTARVHGGIGSVLGGGITAHIDRSGIGVERVGRAEETDRHHVAGDEVQSAGLPDGTEGINGGIYGMIDGVFAVEQFPVTVPVEDRLGLVGAVPDSAVAAGPLLKRERLTVDDDLRTALRCENGVFADGGESVDGHVAPRKIGQHMIGVDPAPQSKIVVGARHHTDAVSVGHHAPRLIHAGDVGRRSVENKGVTARQNALGREGERAVDDDIAAGLFFGMITQLSVANDARVEFEIVVAALEHVGMVTVDDSSALAAADPERLRFEETGGVGRAGKGEDALRGDGLQRRELCGAVNGDGGVDRVRAVERQIIIFASQDRRAVVARVIVEGAHVAAAGRIGYLSVVAPGVFTRKGDRSHAGERAVEREGSGGGAVGGIDLQIAVTAAVEQSAGEARANGHPVVGNVDGLPGLGYGPVAVVAVFPVLSVIIAHIVQIHRRIVETAGARHGAVDGPVAAAGEGPADSGGPVDGDVVEVDVGIAFEGHVVVNSGVDVHTGLVDDRRAVAHLDDALVGTVVLLNLHIIEGKFIRSSGNGEGQSSLAHAVRRKFCVALDGQRAVDRRVAAGPVGAVAAVDVIVAVIESLREIEHMSRENEIAVRSLEDVIFGKVPAYAPVVGDGAAGLHIRGGIVAEPDLRGKLGVSLTGKGAVEGDVVKNDRIGGISLLHFQVIVHTVESVSGEGDAVDDRSRAVDGPVAVGAGPEGPGAGAGLDAAVERGRARNVDIARDGVGPRDGQRRVGAGEDIGRFGVIRIGEHPERRRSVPGSRAVEVDDQMIRIARALTGKYRGALHGGVAVDHHVVNGGEGAGARQNEIAVGAAVDIGTVRGIGHGGAVPHVHMSASERVVERCAEGPGRGQNGIAADGDIGLDCDISQQAVRLLSGGGAAGEDEIAVGARENVLTGTGSVVGHDPRSVEVEGTRTVHGSVERHVHIAGIRDAAVERDSSVESRIARNDRRVGDRDVGFNGAPVQRHSIVGAAVDGEVLGIIDAAARHGEGAVSGVSGHGVGSGKHHIARAGNGVDRFSAAAEIAVGKSGQTGDGEGLERGVIVEDHGTASVDGQVADRSIFGDDELRIIRQPEGRDARDGVVRDRIVSESVDRQVHAALEQEFARCGIILRKRQCKLIGIFVPVDGDPPILQTGAGVVDLPVKTHQVGSNGAVTVTRDEIHNTALDPDVSGGDVLTAELIRPAVDIERSVFPVFLIDRQCAAQSDAARRRINRPEAVRTGAECKIKIGTVVHPDRVDRRAPRDAQRGVPRNGDGSHGGRTAHGECDSLAGNDGGGVGCRGQNAAYRDIRSHAFHSAHQGQRPVTAGEDRLIGSGCIRRAGQKMIHRRSRHIGRGEFHRAAVAAGDDRGSRKRAECGVAAGGKRERSVDGEHDVLGSIILRRKDVVAAQGEARRGERHVDGAPVCPGSRGDDKIAVGPRVNGTGSGAVGRVHAARKPADTVTVVPRIAVEGDAARAADGRGIPDFGIENDVPFDGLIRTGDEDGVVVIAVDDTLTCLSGRIINRAVVTAARGPGDSTVSGDGAVEGQSRTGVPRGGDERPVMGESASERHRSIGRDECASFRIDDVSVQRHADAQFKGARIGDVAQQRAIAGRIRVAGVERGGVQHQRRAAAHVVGFTAVRPLAVLGVPVALGETVEPQRARRHRNGTAVDETVARPLCLTFIARKHVLIDAAGHRTGS